MKGEPRRARPAGSGPGRRTGQDRPGGTARRARPESAGPTAGEESPAGGPPRPDPSRRPSSPGSRYPDAHSSASRSSGSASSGAQARPARSTATGGGPPAAGDAEDPRLPGHIATATIARLRNRSRRLTTRAAILAAVVCALVLSLAYPLKQYLAQRSAIVQLRDENAAKARTVAQLKERKRELNDPAYIESQARERLQYVMPGETAYVVVHQHPQPQQSQQETTGRVDRTSPWYSQLWQSVGKADRAP